MHIQAARNVVMGLTVALAFGGLGCATKKHVREVVAPIEGRVGEVEKKTASNSQSIGELETNVSRVGERVTDVDRKATSAGEEANKANQAAAQANQQAQDARSLAEKGINETAQMGAQLNEKLENIDNFQMVNDQVVHFKFNQAKLTDEAKQKLDELANTASNMKHYVIEVEGFTDKVGPSDYNLELSRKRAQAVVNYLTLNHNIPLRRVHMLGAGKEKLANEGRGRTANKENRRVEVKVWALNAPGQATGMQTGTERQSTGTANRQQQNPPTTPPSTNQ